MTKQLPGEKVSIIRRIESPRPFILTIIVLRAGYAEFGRIWVCCEKCCVCNEKRIKLFPL